jgi:protein-S-isoprenylcysteine O-methyltransferase
MAVFLVWVFGAFTSKQTARSEPGSRRLVELCLLFVAFSLLFNRSLRAGPLGWRVLPASGPLPWAGVFLTFAGIAFSIWARIVLGRNWSAAVTVKYGHSLVCRGPYAIVRHPIYSGFLLAALGTAIAFGEAGCFLSLPLMALAWRLKLGLEEEFMRGEFGAGYESYRGRVKALVPFVW